MILNNKHTTTESSDGFTSIHSLSQTYSWFKRTPLSSMLERKEDSPDRHSECQHELQLSCDSFPSAWFWIVGPDWLSQKRFDRDRNTERILCIPSSRNRTVRGICLLLRTDWPVTNYCSHGTILHFSPHKFSCMWSLLAPRSAVMTVPFDLTIKLRSKP